MDFQTYSLAVTLTMSSARVPSGGSRPRARLRWSPIHREISCSCWEYPCIMLVLAYVPRGSRREEPELVVKHERAIAIPPRRFAPKSSNEPAPARAPSALPPPTHLNVSCIATSGFCLPLPPRHPRPLACLARSRPPATRRARVGHDDTSPSQPPLAPRLPSRATANPAHSSLQHKTHSKWERRSSTCESALAAHLATFAPSCCTF